MSNSVKEIKKISNDVTHIIFEDGKELHLIGTAHVSKESVQIVENTINEIKPDAIAVELDSQRLEVIKNKKKYQETDIIQIIKEKKVLFFIAQLVISSFQKRLAKKFGVKPGAEFIKAVEMAEDSGAELILADRNIGVTLKRVTRMISFWDKCKLFVSFMFSGSEEKNISEETIAEIKDLDNLNEMIEEMGKTLPQVKTVMLDERNIYLAQKIKNNLKEKTVAAVGAAHVPGVLECLKSSEEANLDELEIVPPKSKWSKVMPWIFPVLIVCIFILGFIYGDYHKIGEAAIWWVLVNGTLTSIGCLLAFGHPITIITGFIAAPITSLNPTIGAGMVTAPVQLYLVRPKVKDFENVSDDITSLKRIWQNRLTRALLVFILSSLGSSIGTFAALPFVLRMVS